MKTNKNYYDSVHTWGRVWTIGALLLLLSVPCAVCLHFNVWPEAASVFKALLSVIPVYWPTAIIEVIAFTPMLGAGGTYLSFVTGNISNLKLPCGLAAMDSAKVRANSEEGEVISTIAIASSSITTIIIIAVGVLAFSPVLPKLTAEDSVFSAAFDQVLPAIFGALGASYFAKHWQISIAPILGGVIVLIFAPTLGVGTLLFITLVVAIAFAQLYYKLRVAPKYDKAEKENK